MQAGKPHKAFPHKPGKNDKVAPKVYLVFQTCNVSSSVKQPDEYLLAIKLTAAGAQRIMDLNPGSYIVRGYATKH